MSLRLSLLDLIRQTLNSWPKLKMLSDVQSAFNALEREVNRLAEDASASSQVLLTLDEMLEVQFDKQSPSLHAALSSAGQFSLFHAELELKLESFLTPTPPHLDSRQIKNVSSTMRPPYYLSTIDAPTLCQLAKEGNLHAIKNVKVSSYRLNEIISFGVNSYPATYLGYYNALMIAIAHRHLPVVRYFIEELGAKLDSKGGRLSDCSLIDCAKKLSFLFPEEDKTLLSYLETRVSSTPYKNALSKHSFLNTSPSQPSPNINAVSGLSI